MATIISGEEAGVPGEKTTMGKQLVNFITCGCEKIFSSDAE
jgi:hypothetical protein